MELYASIFCIFISIIIFIIIFIIVEVYATRSKDHGRGLV